MDGHAGGGLMKRVDISKEVEARIQEMLHKWTIGGVILL